MFNGNYYNSILEMHPFANHFRPGMFVFLPLIKIMPTGFWLIIAKVVSFLSCPLIFLYMGKKVLGKSRFIYVIPILWCFNDPLINVMTSHNAATTIIIPFILLAFLFAWKHKYIFMYLFLFFLLLFKENMGLVWLCVGMFLMIEKKEYKHGALITVLGLIFGIIINFYIMPLFNSGSLSHHHNFFNPYAYWDVKILMIVKSLLAVGLIPLIRPASLLYILPAYGVYLLGAREEYFHLFFHYHDFTITIMYVGALFSFKGYLENNTFLNKFSYKFKKNFFRIIVILLILNGIYRLSFVDIFHKKDHAEKYKIRTSLININPRLNNDYDIYVADQFAFYFMDFKKLHIFDKNKPETFSFKTKTDPLYIIYPANKKHFTIENKIYLKLTKEIQNGLSTGKFRKIESPANINVLEFNAK